MTAASEPALRVGARVLLLNPADEVLLIHARDPDKTGLVLDEIGRKLWTRESRFIYRGREHHRLDHVYLARTDDTAPRTAIRHTANERAGLIERRWWSAIDLADCRDKLLPAQLPDLLQALLNDHFPTTPLALTA
jgi:hypothetical protein